MKKDWIRFVRSRLGGDLIYLDFYENSGHEDEAGVVAVYASPALTKAGIEQISEKWIRDKALAARQSPHPRCCLPSLKPIP
jgi:hypothetical protein